MIRFGLLQIFRFDSWFDLVFFWFKHSIRNLIWTHPDFKIRFVIRFGLFQILRFDSWVDSVSFRFYDSIRDSIRSLPDFKIRFVIRPNLQFCRIIWFANLKIRKIQRFDRIFESNLQILNEPNRITNRILKSKISRIESRIES